MVARGRIYGELAEKLAHQVVDKYKIEYTLAHDEQIYKVCAVETVMFSNNVRDVLLERDYDIVILYRIEAKNDVVGCYIGMFSSTVNVGALKSVDDTTSLTFWSTMSDAHKLLPFLSA